LSESEQTKNYSPYHLCYNCVAPLLVCIQLSAHEFSQPGIIVIFSCTMQYYFFLSALVIWRSDRLRRFYRFVICRVLFCQQQRQRSCYLILQPLMAQRDEHFMYMFVYTYLTAPAISLGRWINAILTLMNEGRRRANSPGVIRALAATADWLLFVRSAYVCIRALWRLQGGACFYLLCCWMGAIRRDSAA